MGRLRIVAGERKGRLIRVPEGGEVRPTGERLREAVFSILASQRGTFEGANVLDLFAGTGALGLEALSRGAAACTFVEGDRRVAAVLRSNIATLEYQDVSEVLAVKYTSALALVADRDLGYDLLFVDPPYRMLAEVCARLITVLPGFVQPRGLVVIEGPKGVRPDVGLPVLLERRYGDTIVTLVAKGGDTS
jgi:16S rRNA (guanine966-N2)-methyltransferase